MQLPSLNDIQQAMRIDQRGLRREWKWLRANQHQADEEFSRRRGAWQARFDQSRQRYRERCQALPHIGYPDLPITLRREEILDALRSHQAIIVCGETGSGKSTQLPKLCWEAGFGRRGMIGHTQPRRIAARTIAARLAEELKTSVSADGWVGCKVRFSDQTSDRTLFKLLTDGMLLAETPSDRGLDNYDCVIIDEAHERSLNIDFLMGYLRRLLDRRDDLRVIITSATIDTQRFAEHFALRGSPAPVIEVSGRGYPVEVRYRPWETYCKRPNLENTELPPPDLARHLLHAFDEVVESGPGDVLVFLPTERDIREINGRLLGHCKRMGWSNQIEILPLYARLTLAEQQRVFESGEGSGVGRKRRVVLATNVAESSLTVPNIHYVIDSGTARISRYSPRSKVQRLPIEPISKASADQRAGRCGRIAPGICWRLYSLEDYQGRDPFTTPEIRRTHLAAVLLRSLILRLGPLERFPLLDQPREEHIREGFRTLRELQATDDQRRLTPLGRELGKLPIDPRVARMVYEGRQRGCLHEVIVIAAALEAQDPRERPPERKEAADAAHAPFRDPESDFLSFLRLWRFYSLLKEKLSRSQLRKALQRQFLSESRMREWSDLVQQLASLVRDRHREKGAQGKKKDQKRGLEIQLQEDGSVDAGRYAAIHQALLTGLLSGIGMAAEKHQYTVAGGLKVFLWPGSGVVSSKPKWIMAAEFVETSRRYARTIARIDPRWLESLAGDLVKRSHSDPHWSQKSQTAMCYERVTLFGLPIVPRRPVPLAPVDPLTAREMLIEHGLVEGQLKTAARFFVHNQRLRSLLSQLADRTRQREWVVDPYLLQQCYAERLPIDITSRSELERYDREQPVPSWTGDLQTIEQLTVWLAEKRSPEPRGSGLYLIPTDLLPEHRRPQQIEQFPEILDVSGCELPLKYRFTPGAIDDGISVTVPQAALGQVSDERFGWLVPGLLEEKIAALIKSLPKNIRRNLVPTNDVAREIAKQLGHLHKELPFFQTVCRELSKRAEMQVQPSDFRLQALPAHLQFLIRVVDDGGKVIAEGRNLDLLKAQLNLAASPSHSSSMGVASEVEEEKVRSFVWESIPAEIQRVRGGVKVSLYPGITDLQDCVALRLYDTPQAARKATLRGLIRLFVIQEGKELRSHVKWFPQLQRSLMLLSGSEIGDRWESVLMEIMAHRGFVEGIEWTREAVEAKRLQRGTVLTAAAQELGRWLPELAQAFHSVRGRLESGRGSRYLDGINDIRAQLSELMTEETLVTTPWNWLQHLPRYLKGIDYRLDKLQGGGEARDRANLAIVSRFVADHQKRKSNKETDDEQLMEYRWMIEELRISLFAQPLGVSIKVSPQRLEKMFSQP